MTFESTTQWARLVRLAKGLGLGAKTQECLREDLWEHLGFLPTVNKERPVQGGTVSPSPAPQKAFIQAAAVPSQADAKETAKASFLPRLETANSTQLELRIRHLVEAGADWEALGPVVSRLVELTPTPAILAKAIETAFLHGSTTEVEFVLNRLLSLKVDFYHLVHPAVRTHLVLKFWQEQRGSDLAQLLLRDKDTQHQLPAEQLFIFQISAGTKDKATPFIFYRRHAAQLRLTAREFGIHVGFGEDKLLLTAGSLALQLGYADEAREILGQIKAGTAEHDEGLHLVLTARDDSKDCAVNHYVEMLVARGSPKERLVLIQEFFDATRKLGGFRDRNRPALNELLRDTLTWCPPDTEIWAQLSLLLVQNRDLEGLLPSLYDTFRVHALHFHSPVVDASLWHGPLQIPLDIAMTARDTFWQGVALLHQYVSCGPSQEIVLWQARNAVMKAKKEWRQPAPYSWRELHKAATGWIAKSPYIMENDRQQMLRQLRVAGESEQVSMTDVQSYLSSAEEPQAHVLSALEKLCAEKGKRDLEALVLAKKGAVHHFTNADLNRLWQLACHMHQHDLAWRVASVLQARQALALGVKHAWDISGEKRSQYQFITVDDDTLKACLAGLGVEGAKGARLAHSALIVGPLLPELLGLLDPNLQLAKLTGVPADSIEHQIEKHLSAQTWLTKPKRRFRLLSEGQIGSAQMPEFMQVLPINAWSLLVARLTEVMGVNAWNWQLSKLAAHVNDLIPRLASRQDLKRQTGKVARWLRELSPEQRTAWQDLAHLARALSDEQAKEAIAKFICRVAITMFPNHHMAFTSLQAMRAPVSILWDLEAFVLSESYSRIRTRSGTQNRVLVPNTLQRLESIVLGS
jgi:hypothetical protein